MRMESGRSIGMRCASALPPLLLFILLLLQGAHALTSQDLQQRQADLVAILQQSTLAYVAVAIAILLAALMYMGSSIFNDARLAATSKDTLYQAVFSLFLIASLPVIFLVVSQLCIELFLGGMQVQGSLFDVAETFLTWNFVYFFTHLMIVTMLNVGISSLINQQYTIPIAGVLAPVNLIAFARPLMFAVSMGVTLLSTSLFINSFQIMLVNIVKTTILPVFLPLGVVLRAFPPTMNAGNVLLAIAIGAYIITPAIYAFNIYLITQIVDPPPERAQYVDQLGLMRFFYTKSVMNNILSQSSCPFVQKMVATISPSPSNKYAVFTTPYSQVNDSLANCGVQVGSQGFLDAAANTVARLPTWAQVVLGIDIGSRGISAVVSAAQGAKSIFGNTKAWSNFCSKGTIGKICKNLSGISFALSAISSVSTALLAVTLFIYSFDLIVGTAVSFVILSAIIPFLNFTLLVIFIRDFSQYILGTPISLGHLVRLI